MDKEYEFRPCMETVEIWKKQFVDEARDFEEEIEEVKGALDNERTFQLGSSTEEEIQMHEQNIVDSLEYLSWLESQRKK